MPAPTWANEIDPPATFGWGNWLLCLPEYREYDCIESVYWVKSDSEKVLGTWNPKPNFDYKTFSSEWVKHPDGYDTQGMKEGIYQIGSFLFAGLNSPCEFSRDGIFIDVRAARYSFQLNALSPCAQFFSEKFEERFEITLKSKNLKGLVGGVSSNGRSPAISFSERDGFGLITLSAKFAYIPWNDTADPMVSLDICKTNLERARSGGWGLWNSIFYVSRPWGADELLKENPADMITGTNGWNCGGNLSWDPRENALVMQVGAPHYDIDGSVVDGWFEGAIRGRYVKARFGIEPSQAAGNARLEVVYTDGNVKVATISAKYDATNDIINFNANGFTYSSPQLKLTFGEKKSEVALEEVEPKATTQVAVSKKKSITCLKGVKKRTISGVKPKCPKGFKRA